MTINAQNNTLRTGSNLKRPCLNCLLFYEIPVTSPSPYDALELVEAGHSVFWQIQANFRATSHTLEEVCIEQETYLPLRNFTRHINTFVHRDNSFKGKLDFSYILA